MEILFSNRKSFSLPIGSLCPPPQGKPSGFDGKDGNHRGTPCTIRSLIQALKQHHLDASTLSKPELFSVGESVRAGILVLINDVDWELEGGLDAEIGEGDRVTFISTLHGG